MSLIFYYAFLVSVGMIAFWSVIFYMGVIADVVLFKCYTWFNFNCSVDYFVF
jgi:hypothetical protein